MSTQKNLELMYTRGEISRREFLARLSALGLSSVLVPAFLSRPLYAATPKKGGVFKIGLSGGSTVDSLDPRTFTDTMMQFIGMGVIYNYLAEIDANGNAIPELAESWEPSADASQWHFKLRKGVEFHNGKSMDAQDVIYSINLHRGEETKSGGKSVISNIKNLKANGKYAVIFELKSGHADFPYTLTDYHFGIVPDGTTNFDGTGTGGYKIDIFEPGVRCFAKRNPNYWKAGRAHFDAINILAISDPISRTLALKTGQVDYINRVDKKVAKLLSISPGIQIVEAKYGTQYTMLMLTDVAPYDNNDVRLGLKYAIDRKELITKVLNGYGNLGNDQPIPPILPFFNTELPQRKYDPDKARYHIKKAGAEGTVFKIQAADAGFPGAIDACILFKEHAAKAGIKIDVVRVPNDGYWSNTWMKAPFCVSYTMTRPIADMHFSLTYAEDAAWNETHFKHDRFNALLKASRAELDKAKRQSLYSEMQQIVHDEGGAIVPIFSSNLEAASTKVKCDKYASIWELDGLKLAERWWFES